MSWFSDLVGKVTTDETVDFIVTDALPVANEAPGGEALVDGACYLTVRVRALRLPNTRQRVVERLYGVIHSFATVQRLGGEAARFASATTPSDLAGIDPKTLERVLTIDRVIVGPTPWRGGSLDLQIGLFSVVSTNLAGPFLETMTALSQVGAGFVAAAKPVVEVIQQGVKALTRATDSVKLEIGLDRSYSTPRVGVYALVAASKGALDRTKLSLDPADGKLLIAGRPYIDKPYLVFSIEKAEQRADWGEIPELRLAYQALINEIQKNNRTAAEEAYAAFRRAVLLSPDLIDADTSRLIQLVKTLMSNVFAEVRNSGQQRPRPPAFEQLGLY